jgi:ABC-type transport system substrate-binding protein
MARRWIRSPKAILLVFLATLLASVLACGGTAAGPRIIEKEAIKEVPVEKIVVVEKEVIREIPKEITIERVVIATPTPIPVSMQKVETKVDRVIYAFGEVVETNRHWAVARPSYYQFDPWAETMVWLDAKTNERTRRLAKDWEWSPNGKEWTFHLEEGVQFHNDGGEFTSADVVHAFERIQWPDSQSGATEFFKEAVVEAVDEHTVKITIPFVGLDMVARVSRGWGGGEVLMYSAAQFEKEGVEGIDERPNATGSYVYGGRKQGQSIWFEKASQPHWRGENPDFNEVEIRWVREDVTRLAMLLTSEAHIASLSRELQFEAAKWDMKPASAAVPTNYLTLFYGGLYFNQGETEFDPLVPWANPDTGKKIRQAMNKAINRQGMIDFVLRGDGEPMYNTALNPSLLGWNPKWESDFEELYGYDPEKAKSLMAEAGCSPENPMEFTVYNYVSSDEPETPVMVEALINYWKPIGIDVTILDIDWGTVRKYSRGKTSQIKKGGYGNVITVRSAASRLQAWAVGRTPNYQTDRILENYNKFLELDTFDEEKIGALIRDFGDDKYYHFADIPFFFFRLTVMYNPDVVESWSFPGTSGSKTSHWDLIKAAR